MYVWDQGLNPEPNISWRFLKKCSVYETGRRHCDLCLSEKECIIRNMNEQTELHQQVDRRRKSVSTQEKKNT